MKRFPLQEPSKASWTTGRSCLRCASEPASSFIIESCFHGKERLARSGGKRVDRNLLAVFLQDFSLLLKREEKCHPMSAIAFENPNLSCGGSLPQLAVWRWVLKSSLVCCILTEIAERCVFSTRFSSYRPLWQACAKPQGQTEALDHRRGSLESLGRPKPDSKFPHESQLEMSLCKPSVRSSAAWVWGETPTLFLKNHPSS